MFINFLGLAAIVFVIYWFWLPTHHRENIEKAK